MEDSFLSWDDSRPDPTIEKTEGKIVLCPAAVSYNEGESSTFLRCNKTGSEA